MYFIYHIIINTVFLKIYDLNKFTFKFEFISFIFFFKFTEIRLLLKSFSSEYIRRSQSTACGATEFAVKKKKKPSIYWNN